MQVVPGTKASWDQVINSITFSSSNKFLLHQIGDSFSFLQIWRIYVFYIFLLISSYIFNEY